MLSVGWPGCQGSVFAGGFIVCLKYNSLPFDNYAFFTNMFSNKSLNIA